MFTLLSQASLQQTPLHRLLQPTGSSTDVVRIYGLPEGGGVAAPKDPFIHDKFEFVKLRGKVQ
jgi:hypothetical protein